MLQRNLSNIDGNGPSWWQGLEHGAPTIAGFASLCSSAISDGRLSPNDQSGDLSGQLMAEGQVILTLAADRGTLEIRAKQDRFDSVERFLAVAIEIAPDTWRWLLDKSNARQTVRFLEGFGQLCQLGLVIHHQQREFSLSSRGYSMAADFVAQAPVDDHIQSLLKFGST